MADKLIKDAALIPVAAQTPFMTVTPITIPAPQRYVDIELRVSAPTTGDKLPIVLLSHGHGASNYLSSNRGVLPLAEFWASHGFVVVQPTHLNSTTLSPETPEAPLFYRSRAQDMALILDRLDLIERAVPGLAGRLDREKVAVAGYSLGAFTAGMLLGMQLHDIDGEETLDLRDDRIKAGVLIGAPGLGSRMDGPIGQRYPALTKNTFDAMKAPALVVAGDKDFNPNFSTHKDWRSDAYRLSPAPKSLLAVTDAEHGYGGVAGYDAAETSDENPERVAFVQRMTWAWLWSALHPGSDAWEKVQASLNGEAGRLGHVETR